MSARIDAFLQLGREQGCSDIHLAVGCPPMLRIMRELAPIRYRELTEEELRGLVYEVLNESQKQQFESGCDIDFSYASEAGDRYRFNVFRKADGVAAVARVVPRLIPPLDQLGLPPVVLEI